jgi:hypothetical protein
MNLLLELLRAIGALSSTAAFVLLIDVLAGGS